MCAVFCSLLGEDALTNQGERAGAAASLVLLIQFGFVRDRNMPGVILAAKLKSDVARNETVAAERRADVCDFGENRLGNINCFSVALNAGRASTERAVCAGGGRFGFSGGLSAEAAEFLSGFVFHDVTNLPNRLGLTSGKCNYFPANSKANQQTES